MKQVLARSGKIVVEEIPAPHAPAGGVLVRVARSCISAGTEAAGLGVGTLVGRAVSDGERWKDLARTVLDRGLVGTIDAVRHGLTAGHALGYSLAGWVHDVGSGVTDLRVGDRVACAGAGLASHAEFAAVPRNLVVPIPAGVGFDAASTVALGSIALHGVRRLEPTLGETFVVVGLGLLGQLAAQILRASGCRVIGTDIDPKRVELARQLGVESALLPGADTAAVAQRMTGGHGADGVLITASGSTDEIVSSAFRLCRPKGRVVVVGDVGLNLQRADFYAKELEFRISTSYGPGRYDDRYEQAGLDYPIGYVRWTEGRNMEEYLRLVASGTVHVDSLIAGIYPVQEAPSAYAQLGASAAPMVLLSYAQRAGDEAVERVVAIRSRGSTANTVGVAVVGAGGFARGVHLPNLKALGEFTLRAVMSRNGVTARAAAEQFGADYATTEYGEVLADTDIDAVVICTRHHLHADMALAALRAGKHVLVEKPLAMNPAELAQIEAFFTDAAGAGLTVPILVTGFNRRFSEYAHRIRAQLGGRLEPAMLIYRMNAGYLPSSHWVHGAEGGGRNIGEACHIYDLFTYLIDAPVERVDAAAIRPSSGYYSARDNFTATVNFADGSVATLIYTALGNAQLGKERLEAFSEGVVAVLDDYRRLDFHGSRRAGLRSRRQDKGQRAELREFARVIREGGSWPIPFEHQLAAARISFRVEEALNR